MASAQGSALLPTFCAENEETEYVAYVSEQGNLLEDSTGQPLRHPQTGRILLKRTADWRLRAPAPSQRTDRPDLPPGWILKSLGGDR